MNEQIEDDGYIRPQSTPELAGILLNKLYGLNAVSIKELVSYSDKNYHVIVNEKHDNPYVDQISPFGYVLKLMNSTDSLTCHVEIEHEMQIKLRSSGINCSLPVQDICGRYQSLQSMANGKLYDDATLQGVTKHAIHLVTYLPGEIMFSVPFTSDMCYQLGAYLARVHSYLQDFTHPKLDKFTSLWDLKSVPQLVQYLYATKDINQRNKMADIIRSFQNSAESQFSALRKAAIHGDFNAHNIIVKPRHAASDTMHAIASSPPRYDICGLVDFGDASYSYLVFDIAIAMVYIMLDGKELPFLEVGGHFLAGYLSEGTMSDVEWSVLKLCIESRYCQSYTLGQYNHSKDPGNEYILVTAGNVWKQIVELTAMDNEALCTKWKDIISTYK